MGMLNLRGQTALVTGGARRLGRAIVEALAGEGVNVLVHYNSSAAEAEQATSAVRALGVQAWTVQADLADPAQAEALWEQAQRLAPDERIEILINNASIFPEDNLMSFTAGDLEKNMRVNALAPALIGRRFAAGLGVAAVAGRQGAAGQGASAEEKGGEPGAGWQEAPEQEAAGRQGTGAIVNLLDSRMAGRVRSHVSYQLSKRLLCDLTRLMAREFAPRIRVNGVAPGMVLPPPGTPEDSLRRLAGTNLLGRWGSPQDVARAVLFLLQSDFITGQVLFVDGGGSVKECLYG